MRKLFLNILAALGLVSITSGVPAERDIVPVRPFDKQKYLGRWYEIARMDFRFERNLKNVTATYSAREDGSIKVENRGYNYVTKEWKQVTGKAKLAGKPDEASLKVSFFGPFYSAYIVIALDKDYKYALVAGESLKYLWILARETTIPETIKQEYLKKAAGLGFDVSALVWVEHD
jgi:apolipoprotein D and lipocalin family protein